MRGKGHHRTQRWVWLVHAGTCRSLYPHAGEGARYRGSGRARDDLAASSVGRPQLVPRLDRLHLSDTRDRDAGRIGSTHFHPRLAISAGASGRDAGQGTSGERASSDAADLDEAGRRHRAARGDRLAQPVGPDAAEHAGNAALADGCAVGWNRAGAACE